MNRGEIWTSSGGGDFAGKPRPVVIVQDDRFSRSLSVTVCPFTSEEVALPLFRIQMEPTAANGLDVSSSVMVDKITTVRSERLGRKIGQLTELEFRSLDAALRLFLGINS